MGVWECVGRRERGVRRGVCSRGEGGEVRWLSVLF